MLQVKDPQEVFDKLVRPQFERAAKDVRQELDEEDLNIPYSIFVLGEMYGTISTCLAQNIPIPKEMWDMPVIKSFVRGDVADVVVVDESEEEDEDNQPMTLEQAQEIYTQCDPTFSIPLLIKNGFNPADWK